MEVEPDSLAASEFEILDRRIIQVDLTPAQAGITAALRRAFEAAASEPSSRDFDELLRRLN
jgi:hypothetical protein